MSRYIDADALIEEMQRCSYETWSKDVNRAWWAQAVKVKDNIVQCIEKQPTADVVEVVRCKDCKHWEHEGTDYLTQRPFGACKCEYWEHATEYFTMSDNDYCSYGERKEECG